MHNYFIQIKSDPLFLEGRDKFREFLRSEFSEENVLFWLACEELKKQTNPESIEERARSIYEDYISILSPKEVQTLVSTCIAFRVKLSCHCYFSHYFFAIIVLLVILFYCFECGW